MRSLRLLLRPKAVPRRSAARYVFIITYARSGSTLLQKILTGIAECHFTGENADALGGLFASWRAASEAKEQAREGARAKLGDPWRGAHLIDPDRYNQRLAEVFLDEIVGAASTATLIGFKEVRYFNYGEELPFYLDYMRRTFRPALLVFNRRNPADVAKSGWWKDHPSDIAEHVLKFDAITDSYSRRHPEDTIILDYDRWSRDPEHLRPLFDRLGQPFNRSALLRTLAERLDH
jgi:hypothetical protein